MYRVHLFGYVVAAMAVVALAAVSTEPDVRALMFPGAAVAMAGLIVGALGSAFYYHHGAWGALELSQQSFQGATEHIAALRLDTEYVTCLVRFARVFFGLGLVVLAAGLLRWGILPTAIAGTAALLGVAGMALTMALARRTDLVRSGVPHELLVATDDRPDGVAPSLRFGATPIHCYVERILDPSPAEALQKFPRNCSGRRKL